MMLTLSRLFVLFLLSLAAPVVTAQSVAPAKEGNAWVAFVVAIFLVVLVVGGAFMSSRRGHQD